MWTLLFFLACSGDGSDVTEPDPSTPTGDTGDTDTATPPPTGTTGDTAEVPTGWCAPTTNALRFDCPATGTLRWWPADDPTRVHTAEADGSYIIWGLRSDVDTLVELPDGSLTRVVPGALPQRIDDALMLATGTASSAMALPNPCEGQDLLVVDDEGRLVWYEEFQAGVAAIDITPDGTFLVLIGGARLIEVDVHGNALLNVADFEHPMHHDVSRDDDGFTYALYAERVSHEGDDYVLDGLYVLDRAGAIVDDWRLYEHLPAGTLVPGERGFYWEGKFPGAIDFSHGNSVEVAPDGGLMLSFRWLHSVMKVTGGATTPGFGTVEWALAAPQGDLVSTYQLIGDDPRFDGQHHATLDEQGRVWLFDNGEGDDVSRAMRFDLDGTEAPVGATWDHTDACPVQGAAYPTADDGVLLSCSTHGEIRELGPSETTARFSLDLACATGRTALLNRAVPIDDW